MNIPRTIPVRSDGRTQMAGALVLSLALGLLGLACQPSIGDACVLSTDCSQRGDRLCDTSQPNGYCTIFNCVGNGCPDDGACVVFGGRVPGCLYTDRSIARTARSFCMKTCELDTDCRAGYVCRDPRVQSLQGIVLDDDQSRPICVPIEPDNLFADASTTAPVCAMDAGPVPPIVAPEGGAPDASREGGADADASAPDSAPTDSGSDGARDADAGGG